VTGKPRLFRRSFAAVALCAVTALLAAGCAAIPTESPVEQAQATGVQQEPQLITNVPAGPTPGATREEIVSEFFAAMLAYPQSLTTARQFLTADAATAWDPTDGLVVYDDEEITTSRGQVSVTVHVRGRLDRRGAWTTATAATRTQRIDLRLERERGEWRIANPPNGTFIDNDYFTQYFRQFSLYYFDPTMSVLTPDPVYLMLDDTTATALVSDLLRGPQPDLSGVAATAVPPRTELDVAVTTSNSGRVDVPLTPAVLSLSAEQRRLLAAQLTWTLGQLPEVRRISVTVGGSPVDIPGVTVKGVFSVDEFAGYDPSFASLAGLYALSSKGLVTVSEGHTTPVSAPISKDASAARYVAVDPTAAQAALVVGRKVLVGGTEATAAEPSVWFRGTGVVIRPSWDVHGVLWVVDNTPSGARVYTVTASGARRVSAPGIDGRRVSAFAVSRDGVRLVAILSGASSSRLVVSVIDRQADHPAAVQLSPAQRIRSPGFGAVSMSDLAWASPTTLLVLASKKSADPQPYEVSIDGSNASAVGGFLPVRPVSVAAGPNVNAPLVIGGRGGEIYVQTPEQQWLPFGGLSRLRSPVYPG
jgi:Lipoprotein LpqB beta-propeller domain/Sporulation and spore germination